ncbi:MAG TPA: peptide-methionine (S)-S-oxide reductase MsrA [Gemmatimonadaceae bacterium]|jgi:peptide-methionine (S)-S-oxide reductase|nr:peptide-methionine (S)-S-oxide reductase MsrA [Gemmatimonadaceae bacterium]
MHRVQEFLSTARAWRGGALLALAATLASSVAVAQHPQPAVPPARDTALFAGGCFWSMQKAFDHVPGVVATTAGYAGGHTPHPSYEDVESQTTGHAESVQVIYNPAALTYDKLLTAYWHSIDPVDPGGAFCDRGPQYRSVIFARDSVQRQIAQASKTVLARRFNKPIATEIVSTTVFYPAEEYHQEFYKKNPVRYTLYREGCGRDRELQRVWGKEAGQ